MAIVPRKNRDGSTTYQVKVLDRAGKWYPTPGFRDRLDAEQEELRLSQLKRKGGFAISDDAKMVTFDQFWEIWSVENRGHVSEGWKITQNQMYRTYIKPVLGEIRMIQIKAPEIGRVLSRAQAAGLGDQSRKHIYSLVRKMFNDAVEYYEMLAVSPVKPKFHRPKVSEKKRNFLLPKQSWKLLEHTKDHYLGPAIWLQLLSGLRPSEVQALKGKSLHFELNQILICAAFNNKVKKLQNYPKQENWDYAPMPVPLKEYLLSLRTGPEEFVAKSLKGEMLPYETYLKSLKKICIELGFVPLTPHELRHTCTEIYIQAGASAEDIRRLLNHQSLSATKHYIHRTDERLNAIAGRVSSELFPKTFPNGEKDAYSHTEKEISNVH